MVAGDHMRLKNLRGLPVVDPLAARKIGFVTDFQVDPVGGRLAALDVDGSSAGGGADRISARRIRRVGRHAVMLTSARALQPTSLPDGTDGWLDSTTLYGLEVLGDDG